MASFTVYTEADAATKFCMVSLTIFKEAACSISCLEKLQSILLMHFKNWAKTSLADLAINRRLWSEGSCGINYACMSLEIIGLPSSSHAHYYIISTFVLTFTINYGNLWYTVLNLAISYSNLWYTVLTLIINYDNLWYSIYHSTIIWDFQLVISVYYCYHVINIHQIQLLIYHRLTGLG